MAWGGAGGPPARAHPVFGRFLKKKLYSFGLTVDPDRDDSLAQWLTADETRALSTYPVCMRKLGSKLFASLNASIRACAYTLDKLVLFHFWAGWSR